MSEIKNITGAEALLYSLIEEGATTIFGYPGGQVIPIYDKLYGFRDRIHHILTRHEQGAAHAAQGFARVTGKVGVCMATSGPGATNLITGIADAMLDSTPLVCITGQVPASSLGNDAFQEADIISIAMPITKWNFQVTSSDEIPWAIARAFYIARSGRPGPVLIDITKNAQVEKLDFEYKKCNSLRCYEPVPNLDKSAVDEAVELINRAKKPLLLIGQGIKISGAEQEIIDFTTKANIPVATTLMGISVITDDLPTYIGMLGMHGNIAPNVMTQNADLIIAIGMRFSDRVTGDLANYAKQAKIIHIDIDRSEINKVVKVDIGIVADAKDALLAMTPQISTVDRTEWLQFAKEQYDKEIENVITPSINPDCGPIRMGEAINELTKATGKNAVIVTDVGQQQMFSARYSKFRNTRSFITSGGLGTMGFGLPASMGAKIGAPDKVVVAILGDGGFQMTMQELGTIMQNKIGVKIVILNNSFLGMVRQWQQLFFEKRYSFTELENPDFVRIASAYDIPSCRVTDRCDLKNAIDTMLNTEGAYLLEIAVANEENVFPMIPAGASLSDLIFKE